MQEGPFPTFPAYSRHSSRKARAFLFVAVFIVLIAIVIVAGNFFLSSHEKGDDKPTTIVEMTPTPREQTPKASPTATLTPTATELDKSELSVQALNGSGTAGAASDLAAVLRETGYTVSSTGNADRFDYEETVIQIKKSQAEYGDALIEDLSAEYEVSPEVETLAESARFDAIVIVGSN